MINDKGVRICDREVGSIKKGWRGCRCKAVGRIPSKFTPWIYLDLCAKHLKQEKRK